MRSHTEPEILPLKKIAPEKNPGAICFITQNNGRVLLRPIFFNLVFYPETRNTISTICQASRKKYVAKGWHFAALTQNGARRGKRETLQARHATLLH